MREWSFGGVPTQALGEGVERDHEVRQIEDDLRIGLEIGQAPRRRNFLAAFDHRLGPEFESLGRVQHRLVERIARRDAARQASATGTRPEARRNAVFEGSFVRSEVRRFFKDPFSPCSQCLRGDRLDI